MNLTRAVLVSMTLAFTAASAAAESGAASAPKPGKDERLVCFAQKTTGSHLRKRICMTPEEQERRRKADQEAMNNTRRATSGAGTIQDQR